MDFSHLLGIDLAVGKCHVVLVSKSDGAACPLMLGFPTVDGSRRVF